MSIKISFSMRPVSRLFGGKCLSPQAVEELVRGIAEERGYACERIRGCSLVTFCPEGFLWLIWKRRRIRGECQTNIVGPGFHAAVIDFLEQVAGTADMKLKVIDKTGYYWKRDFLAMRRKSFHLWFSELMKLMAIWDPDKEQRVCFPTYDYLPEDQEGKLITHIRPFSNSEIRGVANSGLSMAFARDFFIWNEIEKDAYYYRNCGLVLLNQACMFMPSKRSEDDCRINGEIITYLEKALEMDPKIPFPRKEYLEVCSLALHEPVDVSGTELLPGEIEIGCRKHIIYRPLGNINFGLPGNFVPDEKRTDGMDHYYDGRGYGDHDYYIYGVVIDEKGIAQFKDVWFKQGVVDENYLFDVGTMKGRAVAYQPEEKDGEIVYVVAGQVLYKEQRTNISVTCRRREDREWALDLIKKITIAE